MKASKDNSSLATADLFSGLMMVFMLISVLFMQRQQQHTEEYRGQTEVIRQLIDENDANENVLYNELTNEFQHDLERWDAVIDRDTLTIRFENPQILFDNGSETVSNRFKRVLREFWPRYLQVIRDNVQKVNSLSINGHTSSVWNETTPPEDAYFMNMGLSQGRTRNVLEYCSSISDNAGKEYISKYVSANGLSSSKPMLDSGGNENLQMSRRVEFVIHQNNNSETINELIRQLGE